MNKLVKLLTLLLVVIILGGCQAKSEVATFTRTSDGQQGIVKVTHTGQTVENMDMSIHTPFPSDETGEIKEAIQSQIDTLIDSLEQNKGVQLSSKLEDHQLVINIVINFKEVDFNKLKNSQFGQIIGETSLQDVKNMTYSEMKTYLINEGFEEK